MLKIYQLQGHIADISRKFSSRKDQISQKVNEDVMKIIYDVEKNGDKALLKYCRQFDGFEVDNLQNLIVSKQEIMEGVSSVGKDFIRILERTKEQLIDFHQHQIAQSWSIYKDNGVIMGQIVRGLQRVALYVPGGTAAYPSTVLMNAIPAQLAGVQHLMIMTPVKKDGKVNPAILAAAYVCGIEEIYKVGGAQGIAAAAIGTATIPRADKIVGPGNIYVATAKKCCYGRVDIDMIAGPSEILIVADEKANPRYIAADLMSQAEHDPLASAILVTPSQTLVDQVNEQLKLQMTTLSRTQIIEASLADYGGAILVEDIEEAFAIANELAPEHLEVLVDDPLTTLPFIQNAGSIFLGEYSPEPLGDYMSGTNHVLPTGGTAKFYSALGVYDFVKYSSYSYYPKSVLKTFQDDVITFAKKEGLDAHANSIAVRFEEGNHENESHSKNDERNSY